MLPKREPLQQHPLSAKPPCAGRRQPPSSPSSHQLQAAAFIPLEATGLSVTSYLAIAATSLLWSPLEAD